MIDPPQQDFDEVSADRSKPFRCIIPLEECVGTIRVGRREVACNICDLSREDFRVQIPAQLGGKLDKARRIELLFHGERWLVKFSGVDPDQPNVVLLNRVEELTRVAQPSPWNTLVSLRMSKDTDPRFVLAVLLAIIAVFISMPGIGDRLGTAAKIKSGVHSVFNAFL